MDRAHAQGEPGLGGIYCSGLLWGWRHRWLRSRTGAGREQVTAGPGHDKGMEEAGRRLTTRNEIN